MHFIECVSPTATPSERATSPLAASAQSSLGELLGDRLRSPIGAMHAGYRCLTDALVKFIRRGDRGASVLRVRLCSAGTSSVSRGSRAAECRETPLRPDRFTYFEGEASEQPQAFYTVAGTAKVTPRCQRLVRVSDPGRCMLDASGFDAGDSILKLDQVVANLVKSSRSNSALQGVDIARVNWRRHFTEPYSKIVNRHLDRGVAT